MLKCKHQCHYTCSSEIGTCIIIDAGRQAAHKKQRKYTFFGRISPMTIYSHDLEVDINFQCKKNFQQNYQTYRHYPFNIKMTLATIPQLNRNWYLIHQQAHCTNNTASSQEERRETFIIMIMYVSHNHMHKISFMAHIALKIMFSHPKFLFFMYHAS